MNELSLFTGAGGGILGTKLLGFKHIGYVEYDDFCQRVLAQRIKDGHIDNAPIYGDIRAFIDTGCCELYKGITDIITAGFPCQPFSVAGKQQSSNDERNMWPQTLEVIQRIRPPFCFLENVPGLLSAAVDDTTDGLVFYFGEILKNLAEIGYDAVWTVLGADDVGAIHRRKRVWILCTDTDSKPTGRETNTREHFVAAKMGCGIRQGRNKKRTPTGSIYGKTNDTDLRRQRGKRKLKKTVPRFKGLPWGENLRSVEDITNRSDIPQPLFRGVDDGLADGLDYAHAAKRLKAVGNGQCPQTLVAAFNVLFNAMEQES